MKVLLDECVPRKFKRKLRGHNFLTAAEAGLAGLKNGALLRQAETMGFNALLTVDNGVGYRQNLADREIAIIIVHARSNRLADLIAHASACLETLLTIWAGQVIHIGS